MRIKRGIVSRRKHKKVLSLAKGYLGTRHKLIRVAKQAVLQAGNYAFAGRKLRKRNFRALWITRISHAVKNYGINYSVFIKKLQAAKISLDRKILADLAVNDPETFKHIVETAKKA